MTKFKYRYARVDIAMDWEDGYLIKVRFNGEYVEPAVEKLAEYLDRLGQDGWKMINAQTVGLAADHRQEVYYFERLVE